MIAVVLVALERDWKFGKIITSTLTTQPQRLVCRSWIQVRDHSKETEFINSPRAKFFSLKMYQLKFCNYKKPWITIENANRNFQPVLLIWQINFLCVNNICLYLHWRKTLLIREENPLSKENPNNKINTKKLCLSFFIIFFCVKKSKRRN